MHRAKSLALALALVVATGAPAAADAPTDRIRTFFGSVNRVIADPGYDDRLPERLGALRALVIEMVDFRRAASTALGLEWVDRTASEREEFVRLFTDLLQASVFASVGGRARIDNGLSVAYIGELTDPDGITVATTVLTRSGEEMAVGYRMSRRQGRWMVHDVVVDGVSLVDNYRAQFHAVMQRSSYAGLVREMRARIADLGRPGPPDAAVTAPISVVSAASVAAVVAPPDDSPVETSESAPIAAAVPPPVLVTAAPGATAPVAASASLAVTPAGPAPVAPVRAEPRPVETPEPVVRAADAARPAPAPPGELRPAEAPAVVASAGRASAPRPAPAPAYWVQVGAFRNVERAIDLVTALGDHAVSLLTTPEQPLMRVLIGPFTDRDAAAATLRALRARGYEPFIAEAGR